MGNTCAGGNRSQSPQLHHTSTEEPIHDGSVLCLALTKNCQNVCSVANAYCDNTSSKCLISCSDDKRIGISPCAFFSQKQDELTIKRSSSSIEDKHIWKVAGEHFNYRTLYLRGHQRSITHIATTGNTLCSVSRDHLLAQWNLSSLECVHAFKHPHDGLMTCVALREAANSCCQADTAFTGARDGHVKGWDLETHQCTADFTCPNNSVTSMVFSDPNTVVQCAEDLCLRGWDTRSGYHSTTPSFQIDGFSNAPLCLAVSSNGLTSPSAGGHLLAVGCKGFQGVGCEVKLWDLRHVKNPLVSQKKHEQDVTSCAFSADGKYLFSVSKDGSMYVWDAQRMSTSTESVWEPVAQLTSAKAKRHYTSLVVDAGCCESLADCYVGALDGSITKVQLKPLDDARDEGREGLRLGVECVTAMCKSHEHY